MIFNSPTLQTWVDRFLMPIDDPTSRLFHLNLIAALAMILIWFFGFQTVERRYKYTLKRLLFKRRYWWNRSTRQDYALYLFNSLLKVFLFIPFLDFSYEISRWTVNLLVGVRGDFVGLHDSTLNIALFTVGVFVWDDGLRFIHHWLMHWVPWLWKLHCVHHSARVLTPITLYRIHPLESAIATVRNSVGTGVATGMFIFLFQSQFTLATVFGINAFAFTFNLLGANLRHSHIPISFGWLENLFISPRQHQIHHTRMATRHHYNLGVSLSIWDRLIGSWRPSYETRPPILTVPRASKPGVS